MPKKKTNFATTQAYGLNCSNRSIAYGAFTIVARADATKLSCEQRNSQSVIINVRMKKVLIRKHA